MTTVEELRAALLDQLQVGVRHALACEVAGRSSSDAAALGAIVQRVTDCRAGEKEAITAADDGVTW